MWSIADLTSVTTRISMLDGLLDQLDHLKFCLLAVPHLLPGDLPSPLTEYSLDVPANIRDATHKLPCRFTEPGREFGGSVPARLLSFVEGMLGELRLTNRTERDCVPVGLCVRMLPSFLAASFTAARSLEALDWSQQLPAPLSVLIHGSLSFSSFLHPANMVPARTATGRALLSFSLLVLSFVLSFLLYLFYEYFLALFLLGGWGQAPALLARPHVLVVAGTSWRGG